MTRMIRINQQRLNILYRKSHKGKDVKIYYAPFSFDQDINISTEKKYIVWADGAVALKTDSLKSAEDEYTKQCKKHYNDTHGRFQVGRHILDKGIVKTIGVET